MVQIPCKQCLWLVEYLTAASEMVKPAIVFEESLYKNWNGLAELKPGSKVVSIF